MLVIFDVDGTLVDSQVAIVAAMRGAFETVGRAAPAPAAVLAIVGLSLPQAMARLLPGADADEIAALVAAYKQRYVAARAGDGAETGAPFYPGARAALARLRAAGHLLGVATGKARRGLEHLIAAEGLEGVFAVTQTADDAPSKPDPAMVLNCLAAVGADPRQAVVVGDTEFDMDMARAAGVRGIGVAWGYHPVARLWRGGASRVIAGFDDLDAALAE